MRHLTWEDETGHNALFYTYLNNRRTGMDATKPRTLGLLGHSDHTNDPLIKLVLPCNLRPASIYKSLTHTVPIYQCYNMYALIFSEMKTTKEFIVIHKTLHRGYHDYLSLTTYICCISQLIHQACTYYQWNQITYVVSFRCDDIIQQTTWSMIL